MTVVFTRDAAMGPQGLQLCSPRLTRDHSGWPLFRGPRPRKHGENIEFIASVTTVTAPHPLRPPR